MKLEPMTPDPTPAWWVGSVAIRSGDGKEIARVRERKDFDANQVARRIAACVNACEGIPTEALEGASFAPADDETPVYELVRYVDPSGLWRDKKPGT